MHTYLCDRQTHTHTHTERDTTTSVTLAAHARRRLIIDNARESDVGEYELEVIVQFGIPLMSRKIANVTVGVWPKVTA